MAPILRCLPVVVVPSENTVRVAILGLTMILLCHRFCDIHPLPKALLCSEVPSRAGLGKPRAPASTRCLETKCETAPLDEPRPDPLGHPVPSLGRLATSAGHRPARDRHPVAQKRVSPVLDMEEPTEMAGKAERSRRGS